MVSFKDRLLRRERVFCGLNSCCQRSSRGFSPTTSLFRSHLDDFNKARSNVIISTTDKANNTNNYNYQTINIIFGLSNIYDIVQSIFICLVLLSELT